MRLSCLPRGMGEAQGKKVSPTPLRLRRSRRSRPLARSAKERPWSAPNSILGEDVADVKGPAQESRHARRRERSRSVGKGRHPIRRQPVQRQCPQPPGLRRSCRDRGGLVEGIGRGQALPLPQAQRSELHRAPSSPICPMTRTAKTITLADRATASRRLNAPCLPQGPAQPTAG